MASSLQVRDARNRGDLSVHWIPATNNRTEIGYLMLWLVSSLEYSPV